MALVQVLNTTDTESEIFLTNGNIGYLLLSNFAGGNAWSLQMQDPDGDWINVDSMRMNGNGVWRFDSLPGQSWRILGGTVGAKIWFDQ